MVKCRMVYKQGEWKEHPVHHGKTLHYNISDPENQTVQYEEVADDSGENELPFNRKRPPAEPHSGRVRHNKHGRWERADDSQRCAVFEVVKDQNSGANNGKKHRW